jgi:hypothetical protein
VSPEPFRVILVLVHGRIIGGRHRHGAQLLQLWRQRTRSLVEDGGVRSMGRSTPSFNLDREVMIPFPSAVLWGHLIRFLGSVR